jgi:hypothetical protein
MHRLYITVTALALALSLHLGAGITALETPASVYAECATNAEGRNVDATYFAEMLMMLQQKPHPFAVKALMDWKPMEGTRACWNPLSTTWDTDDSANFNCLNPPECTMGVQDFPNKVRGQQATSKTLALSFYGGLRNFLSGKSFDPEEIRQSIYTWGGDDAYADVMIERWGETWQQRRSEALKPPSGVSATNEGAKVVVRWTGTRQGQQAMSVWRWQGEAWSQIGRVSANVSEFTDKDPLPKGQGAYMVCTEGTSDSACSDKASPASRTSSSAGSATKVNVTSFPSSVHRGTTVFIRAVTSPGAACALSARPGAKSKDSTEATANASGAVTWTWPVATNASAGSFDVKVTCGTASVTKTLTIE